MIAPTKKQLKRIRQLFAMLGSSAEGERDTAWKMLDELLQKLRLGWNDLPGLLTPETTAAANVGPDTSSSSSVAVNALDIIHYMLRSFIDLKPSEYTAVALWVLHTHVYDKFLISPRLALVSPVRGCGKTTLLAVLELLAARAYRTDHISPAALFRTIHDQRGTQLIDEADNADLAHSGILRAVLNSGHRKGGSTTRFINNQPKRFETFGPLAIATIGSLPLPVMARSIVIHMQRTDGGGGQRRLDDPTARLDLDTAYQVAFAWSRQPTLNLDPDMPASIKNRAADNWRPLIAIADAFGPGWGEEARAAALSLTREISDEDVAVTLLIDVREIFDGLAVDRLPSAELIEYLIDLEDAPWSAFRGLNDSQTPRRLSQAQLAAILRPFDIRPRSIWPRLERARSQSRKGYLRVQFEAAWARYCSETGTPTQSRKTKGLGRHIADT